MADNCRSVVLTVHELARLAQHAVGCKLPPTSYIFLRLTLLFGVPGGRLKGRTASQRRRQPHVDPLKRHIAEETDATPASSDLASLTSAAPPPEQAFAVVEMLNELRELIYAHYLQQIQDHLRADRQTITRTPCEDDPSF